MLMPEEEVSLRLIFLVLGVFQLSGCATRLLHVPLPPVLKMQFVPDKDLPEGYVCKLLCACDLTAD